MSNSEDLVEDRRFICPECGSHYFGTASNRGYCHGTRGDEDGVPVICSFSWDRTLDGDDRVFVGTGRFLPRNQVAMEFRPEFRNRSRDPDPPETKMPEHADVRFNLNDTVIIKVNGPGREALMAARCGERIDKDGIVKMQLWRAMQVFGPALSMGAITPAIEMWIELPRAELVDSSDDAKGRWARDEEACARERAARGVEDDPEYTCPKCGSHALPLRKVGAPDDLACPSCFRDPKGMLTDAEAEAKDAGRHPDAPPPLAASPPLGFPGESPFPPQPAGEFLCSLKDATRPCTIPCEFPLKDGARMLDIAHDDPGAVRVFVEAADSRGDFVILHEILVPPGREGLKFELDASDPAERFNLRHIRLRVEQDLTTMAWIGVGAARAPTDPATCKHEEFGAAVGVHRISVSDDDPRIIGYTAEIKIRCHQCGEPFRFVGLPMGLNPRGATASLGGLEARLAIVPQSLKGDVIDPATPPIGFTVRMHDGFPALGDAEPTVLSREERTSLRRDCQIGALHRRYEPDTVLRLLDSLDALDGGAANG